jgi:hypothetical protein
MLAVLNTEILSLSDLHHVPDVARQLRRFASHPGEALAWVLNFSEALCFRARAIPGANLFSGALLPPPWFQQRIVQKMKTSLGVIIACTHP